MPNQAALNRQKEIRLAMRLATNERHGLGNRKGPAGNNVYRVRYLQVNDILRLRKAMQNYIRVNKSNNNRLKKAKQDYQNVVNNLKRKANKAPHNHNYKGL